MTGRHHPPRDLPKRQRGLAIVTAVLIVAIVSAIAAYLSLGQQVWIRLAQNLRDRAQAEEAVAGITRAAAQLLRKDTSSATDTLQEEWARELPPFPVEAGAVKVRITDAQARFNLNNLIQPGGGLNGAEIGVLRRLLLALSLNPSLADSLVDWMDPDTSVRPGGAEDAEYLAGTPSYRAANQPLQSIDELRLVRGFTPEIVEKLRAHVTVLPGNTTKPVNINTCGALVLSALFTDLPYSEAEALVKERDEGRKTFASTTDLETRAKKTPAQDVRYDVKTEFFLVELEAHFGRLERRSLALLKRPRNNKAATIEWRSAQL
ncbi:MAG: type II secretion system minor pseudopilin GspK [Gammaproteobacteria bacterium]|nr:type II secretion system minor pseudopilin GspK [Gammaproteobacteria bacterium]